MFYVDMDTRIYHRKNCKCLDSEHNIMEAKSSIPMLYTSGYFACEECSPLLKQYYKEEKDLKIYAVEHGLKMELRDESLYIDTFISSWKIIYTLRYPFRFKLLHENTQLYCKCKVINGNIIKEYHDQEVHYDNLMRYLEYIVNHDEYKNNRINSYRKKKRKTKTDRFLYNRSKNRNIIEGTRRVYNLIDELEAKKKLTDKEEMNYE